MNYTTIKALAKASFIEKRSEFIGYLCPVSTNDEAVNFINNIKAEHRKPNIMLCYILRDNNITRYSDDGEPQVLQVYLFWTFYKNINLLIYAAL